MSKQNFGKIKAPSKKSYFTILLATICIALISRFHGITEAWAWEVAKTLITVNGLVLGFILFGAATLSRRSFTQVLYESMIEETVNKLLIRAAEYEKSGKTLEEWVEKEYEPTWSQAFYDYGYKLGSFIGTLNLSLIMILVSISCSFCLFGFSNTNIGNTIVYELFSLIYYLAIYFFIAGVYHSFRLISIILEQIALSHEKPSKVITRILEEKMKQLHEGDKINKKGKQAF